MSMVKIVSFIFIASALGDQAIPACGKDFCPDDTTMLLQTQADVTSGTSSSKLDRTVKSELAPEENMEQGMFGDLMASGMMKAGFAEFVAMTLFVFIGCGSACANANGTASRVASKPGGSEGNWQFQVALTFGFAITAIAYSIGHISGGQINCAVTFGLWCSGAIGIGQALVNVACQLLGSICGAFLTYMVFGNTFENGKPVGTETDKTGGLGCNAVNRDGGFNTMRAMIGEIMGTFILVITVLETAVNPLTLGNRALACVAIGISVFLAHCVLINVDGCSINPTRSFGPMVVRLMVYPRSEKKEDDTWLSDHWIFWLGPLAGAALAAGMYKLL